MTRDQFIQKLKVDLERWNGQVGDWEEILHSAKGELRAKLQRRLDAWRDQRNLTAHKLREVRVTSDAAWEEAARGADAAWHDLADAYLRAREAFDAAGSRKPPD